MRCTNCKQLREDPDSGLWACECVGVFEDALNSAEDALGEVALLVEDGSVLSRGLGKDEPPVGASFGSAAYTRHAAELLRAATSHHRAAQAAQEALEG